MADLLEQQRLLIERVRELEQVEGEPCPKYRQRTWDRRTVVPIISDGNAAA